MALIRLKRGTRAQLQSAASGGELHEGEPYYVTDEERFAVGTGTSGYVESVLPGDLAEVATSGSYDDLDDKPSIPSSPGDVGARPAGDVPWGEVSGKPATFPPASHTHPVAQISDASTVGRNVLTATNAANARSAIGAGTSNFSGSYNDLTNRPTIPSTPGDIGARPAGDVPWGEVADKPATYPPAAHTHTPASIGAAPTSHTHTIAQVSGLQAALNGLEPTVGLCTMAAGFTATGTNHPRAVKIGPIVMLIGVINSYGNEWSTTELKHVATVPEGFRPFVNTLIGGSFGTLTSPSLANAKTFVAQVRSTGEVQIQVSAAPSALYVYVPLGAWPAT